VNKFLKDTACDAIQLIVKKNCIQRKLVYNTKAKRSKYCCGLHKS